MRTCKKSDCGVCNVNNLTYRAYIEFVDKIKQENPVQDFDTFIQSFLYKKLFRIITEQDQIKYGNSLEHLTILDTVRNY